MTDLRERVESSVAFLRAIVCVKCASYVKSDRPSCHEDGFLITEKVNLFRDERGSKVACPLGKW